MEKVSALGGFYVVAPKKEAGISIDDRQHECQASKVPPVID